MKKILLYTIRFLWKKVDFVVAKIAVKNKFLASLYYLVWSNSFYDEHLSVLRGRLCENKEAVFRRNIHRIEKGLLSNKRHFASGYIEDTVGLYNDLSGSVDSSWGETVLGMYFDRQGGLPEIERARKKFNGSACCEIRKKTKSKIGYEEFRQLVDARASVRYFLNKSVPSSVINKSIDIALSAPTACNRQPFRFISAQKDMVLGVGGFYFPHIIAVVGDLSNYELDRDRHLIYIDGAMSVMLFLLVMETQGVGTCVMNSPEMTRRNEVIRKKLELKDHERVLMFVGFGYPDYTKNIPLSKKKHRKNVVN